MAFADAFSNENINKVLQDPKLMMGLALLSQGRQGSSSQALGQGGLAGVQMVQQAQHAQQLQAYRQQQIQQAEQQRAFQMQQLQAKQDVAQRQQQALQDPNFQSNLGGLAKTLAGLGMPLDDVLKAQSSYQLQQHRDASLAQAQAHFEQSKPTAVLAVVPIMARKRQPKDKSMKSRFPEIWCSGTCLIPRLGSTNH